MRKYGTILIVDDEVEIGEILIDIFTPHFEKVIFCTNAQEAVGVAKATELSVILTDLNMPNLPGDQFVRSLRAMGNVTPIVFLTGFASKEVVISAMRLGVSDILEKPFDRDLLMQTLDRVLEIEKRKRNLYGQVDQEKVKGEKKMLGLLQVVNESKKTS